ncbi:TfoX/Sxy family protein [Streptomyces decoyicus]|uniref:TfoX/Sxy family protein n=1 Tax=Streptomyces decoyicus TaxID=249567 RepID=UPI0004AA6169|nr:TfoX/Sxy family protein [Streptomyces decoyicus]KOG41219.1 hypothetical protein ADK74_21990 [Streptomyces decoyicus]QZY20124.1 TfoX/Sxy family protein [Streptomyces decoyicus]
MAYEEALAEGVRERLEPEGVVAKKMFGGLTLLLNGNALANVDDEGLMVRIGPDGMDDALAHLSAQPLVFRGKEQRGWVLPAEKTLDDDVLDEGLQVAIEVTAELAPK